MHRQRIVSSNELLVLVKHSECSLYKLDGCLLTASSDHHVLHRLMSSADIYILNRLCRLQSGLHQIHTSCDFVFSWDRWEFLFPTDQLDPVWEGVGSLVMDGRPCSTVVRWREFLTQKLMSPDNDFCDTRDHVDLIVCNQVGGWSFVLSGHGLY